VGSTGGSASEFQGERGNGPTEAISPQRRGLGGLHGLDRLIPRKAPAPSALGKPPDARRGFPSAPTAPQSRYSRVAVHFGKNKNHITPRPTDLASLSGAVEEAFMACVETSLLSLLLWDSSSTNDMLPQNLD
jgi:hypothetical protein